MVDVSVVIPMKNEEVNVGPLLEGIAEACSDVSSEIIVIDDGSDDATAAEALRMNTVLGNVRLLSHPNSAGQSAAVHSGVLAAKGRVICTLDGDGQNPPSELPKLFQPLLADETGKLGLVAGQRVARQDTLSKRWGSKFANGLRAWILKDGTRDTGCGLKGFRRDAFLALPYFDHMHRYLPALFKRDNWEILLVDVSHRERQAGSSNYTNFRRALVGIPDLLAVSWLIRRRKKAQPQERFDAGQEGI
ncbi:glycosyltransferase family 2 protein [Aliiruegeria lutimaris]|uniref:Glycosyltransferase involved in cell wall bisynthesis n=1 Tax=Aliiruegeria lutimaris TaxID=571298 RepID=A0A1G8M3V4_9RHOB|nr:glycosyltransferase family 2 protein [Aliiruegeria lutimaris]SDI62629.1 Glycosyltransferase involved in cell wall bisynthesis [Aliiruegeria lutimaris]